jgi:hypothetical protein
LGLKAEGASHAEAGEAGEAELPASFSYLPHVRRSPKKGATPGVNTGRHGADELSTAWLYTSISISISA